MVRVESVEVRRGRGTVLLDDGTRLQVFASLLRERPLQAGDELDPEEYREWLLLHQYRSALDRAVASLAERPHSEEELRQLLLRAGYLSDTADMVVYKLHKEGLTDDEAFARAWVSSRMGKRLGKRRIAMELQRKGISRDIAEDALEAAEPEDELEYAVSLASRELRKIKPGEDPRKSAQRILALLARRGYSYDVAREALSQAKESAEVDEE